MNHLDAQRIALKAAQKYRAHLAVVDFHTREADTAAAQIERLRPVLTAEAAHFVDQVIEGKPVSLLHPLPGA